MPVHVRARLIAFFIKPVKNSDYFARSSAAQILHLVQAYFDLEIDELASFL